MTYLDFICTALGERTGRASEDWRGQLLSIMDRLGIDIARDTKLLTELPQAEADSILTRLRAPANKMGVLSWLVQGAMMARQANPQDLQTFTAYMNHQQN